MTRWTCRAAVAALLILTPAASPFRLAAQEEESSLRRMVDRFAADRAVLNRRYDAPYSGERRARFRVFFADQLRQLEALDERTLNQEGRLDRILLKNEITYQQALLDREEQLWAEMAPLAPFAPRLIAFQEARRRLERVEPRAVAMALDSVARAIKATRQTMGKENGQPVSKVVVWRTAETLKDLREMLGRWYRFSAGYDPLFSWWVQAPYRETDQALEGYVEHLRKEVIGIREGEDEPIIGDPIGVDGLAADLAHEMIPYSPEELLAIAEREFAWTDARMLEASRELGYGDDWRAALEAVKNLHQAPGDQPMMILEQAIEATEFVESRGLLTVPPLAKEIWRMEMLSPERQKVSPFFLGGEVIQVSFPTDSMAHEDKLMSMRGNNRYFARATVHHELIPGHHLQQFMNTRFNDHRRIFGTPFWGEGWALYWEMLLWDLGFPRSPEEKIGMLFWRSHRAARIIFSLRFHLGTMTPQEAVDFLVERVGHERANAEAEVRRSFNGSYPPLYQAGYMLGGLQFRALHTALVDSGRMTDRQFHDTILRGGPMPVELVRARLLGSPLPLDFRSTWRF